MQQSTSSLQRKYLIYIAIFNGARAYVNSTVILFLVDFTKIPVAAIGLLLAVDLMATFFAEIPTGIYADKIGRHRSFILACGLTCIGFIVFASLPWWANINSSVNVLLILAIIATVVASIGFSFQSGALDAWVVNHLRVSEESVWILTVLANGQAAKSIAFMVAGIAGIGHYYLVEPNQQLFSTFSIAAITVFGLTLFALHQDLNERSSALPDSKLSFHLHVSTRKRTSEIFKAAWAEVLSKKKLMLLIIAGSSCYTLVQLLVFYWPYLLLKEVFSSIPTAGVLSLMLSWVVAYGFRAFGNYLSRHVATHSSLLARLLILSVIIGATLTIFLCVLTGIYHPGEAGVAMVVFATLFYGLIRLTDGFADPLRQWLISELATADRLATIYSIASCVALGISALIAMLAAHLLDQGISVKMILVVAAVFQLFSAPLYFYATKHEE